MSELRHTIQSVAERTGLTPHVIRVWERRYSTVQPTRSEGNQRRYSDEDIRRLQLLNRAVQRGHSIGTIAHLDTPQLEMLAGGDAVLASSPSNPGERKESSLSLNDRTHASGSAERWLSAASAAVASMDGHQLEQILERGAVELGVMSLLIHVVAPLVEQIGEDWQAGKLQIAHEHIASAVLRTQLGTLSRPISLHTSAPVILTTTPAGQLHELGVVLAGALAATQGWRVVYAGPSMPAPEIVAAALRNSAQVVALSLVHPADDPMLPEELIRLRRMLPPTIPLIVGGRSAGAYGAVLDRIGAIRVRGLQDWMAQLSQLRRPPV
jgi:DNA-binding transcriptional MerR regulator/methylmalonyl-CoA mutase cobalamin-binding subunit